MYEGLKKVFYVYMLYCLDSFGLMFFFFYLIKKENDLGGKRCYIGCELTVNVRVYVE